MKFGLWEIILIVIVIAMVFGSGKLPEIGKQIGKGVRDFKKYSSATDEAGNSPKTEITETTKAPRAVEQKTFYKN